MKSENELREQLPDGLFWDRFLSGVMLRDVGLQVSALAYLMSMISKGQIDDDFNSHP
jgi:hypothetical protein